MLRYAIGKFLDSAEVSYGEPLDYFRFILRASLGVFWRFTRLVGGAHYRRILPAGPSHVVRISAARFEDCGPCVQTTVNMAKKEGVTPAVLRAVVDGRPEDLPEDHADVYRFVDRVLRRTGDEGDLREKIRARYGARGDEALSEIAVVLSSARAFPVTKRVLGYATSCSRVVIGF